MTRALPIAVGAYVGTFGSGPLVALVLILCLAVMAFAAAYERKSDAR